MDIILKNEDVHKAIKDYVNKLGIDLAGKSVDVNLTAGRKGSGYSALVSIQAAVGGDSAVVPYGAGYADNSKPEVKETKAKISDAPIAKEDIKTAVPLEEEKTTEELPTIPGKTSLFKS
jgi:hypothetical protein